MPFGGELRETSAGAKLILIWLVGGNRACFFFLCCGQIVPEICFINWVYM